MTPFLDTSILIRFERSYRQLRELGQVRIPSIAVAEFARGIYFSENPRLINRAERFLSRQIVRFPISDFNLAAARSWGILLKSLEDAGQRMKFGDSLIAAQAISENVPLVTADNDYDRVPGLELIRL